MSMTCTFKDLKRTKNDAQMKNVRASEDVQVFEIFIITAFHVSIRGNETS